MSGSLSVPLLLSLSLVLLWWLLPTPTLQQMPPMPMRVQDKDDSAGPLNAEEECGDLPDGGDPDIAADPQTEACSRKVRRGEERGGGGRNRSRGQSSPSMYSRVFQRRSTPPHPKKS